MRFAVLLIATFTLGLPFAGLARADEASPSPSPSPSPGFKLTANGSSLFVDNGSSGPGLQPPEAAPFANGSPLSPMTPYDWFSSAPVTPGIAGQFQYDFTGTWNSHHTAASATVTLGAYDGDTNMLLYWGEPWSATLDPHQGYSGIGPRPYFPTQPGENGVLAAQAVLPYAAQYGALDGHYNLTGGFFNLAQTDTFVFSQAPVTNANPSTGTQTAETLGPGMPSVDEWGNSAVALPLYGADAVLRGGRTTVELSDAQLPALNGTSAHALIASAVEDLGAGGRYSVEFARIRTSGDPISTTTFYGSDQVAVVTPQGRLATSTLAGQDQTLAGIRAFFHPVKRLDALIELGRGWYSTGLAAEPGTNAPGTFEHVQLTQHVASDADAGVDYYRFDPRYGVIVLPYGFPENVWSVAWSWPGNWLKSNYQAVDDTIVGINREGFRLHLNYKRGKLEVHAATQDWRQITPSTLAQAAQEGWIDGYFLPATNGNPTYGWQRQVNLYAAWHLARDVVALDSVWDRSYRPAGNDPIDFVSMNYPEMVLSWQHRWTKTSLGVAGYGRYSANGAWSITPVSAIYDVVFLGGEWDFSNGQQLLATVRHYTMHGLPSEAGGPSPNLQGTTLLVEHRFTL